MIGLNDLVPNIPKFVIEKVGIGAGKREYECVGVLRAMMIA